VNGNSSDSSGSSGADSLPGPVSHSSLRPWLALLCRTVGIGRVSHGMVVTSNGTCLMRPCLVVQFQKLLPWCRKSNGEPMGSPCTMLPCWGHSDNA
jgi:hypothetical protein